MKKYLLLLLSVVSILSIIWSLILLTNSTTWGFNDAFNLFNVGYANVKTDTDILGKLIDSCVWKYKIKGMFFFILGLSIFLACFNKYIEKSQ